MRLNSRFFIGVFALLQLGLAAAATLAQDWPTYRHDAGRSGHTETSLQADHLHEVWRHESAHPPRPAWEAPARWDAYSLIRGLRSMREYDPVFHTITVGGSIYFGSSVDDSLRCLDAATGKVRWIFTTGGPLRVAPSFVDGKLYFGSDDGFAYCLAAVDGKLLWRVRAAEGDKSVLNNQRMISLHPVRTGVLVEEGLAYFAGSLLPWEPTYLCAVDANSGAIEGTGRFRRKLTNQNTLEGPMLSSARGSDGEPGPHLIAPQGRVAPLLFKRDDGAPAGTLEGSSGSFVVVTPEGHILHGPGSKTGWLNENDPKTRKSLVKHDRALNAVITADTAYLLMEDSISAMSRKDRKTIWEGPCDCPFDVILAGGHLFVGGTDRVAAFDAATGRRVWQAPVRGRAFGLTAANGALFVSTDEGVIHCFRAGDKLAPPLADAHNLSESLPPPPHIEQIKDEALLGRWVFQSDRMRLGKVRDLVTDKPAAIAGSPLLESWGPLQALSFDGFTTEVTVAADFSTEKRPTQDFTAEAWVRVDLAADWGGFVGIVQDNGDFERGWILGFNKSNFTFAVATEATKKLTYLPAKSRFEEGQWAHVAGAYDGKTMKIYVNGRLEAESGAQSGPIFYPPKALYTLGSYHDQDEFHKMRGALHEVRVYSRALSREEIARSYTAKRRSIPEPQPRAQISFGPVLEFTAPDRATLRWETPKACPSKVTLRIGQENRTIEDPQAKTSHQVTFDGLRRNRVYLYEIITRIDGKTGASEAYECDTHFNYTEPAIAPAPELFPANAAVTEQAKQALAACGADRGIAVIFGVADGGRLAFEVARLSGLHVLCVETDAARVDQARLKLLAAKVYGSRVCVVHLPSYDAWPMRGDFANLVITAADTPAAIIQQVLRPDGGIAVVAGVASPPRGPLPGAGVWSHQYGRPDNTAFGGETLGGARSTGELETQWLGRPGPRAQADRQPRKPAPLAVGGRLFIQGYPRLTALDAYNGAILWSLETPPVVRFNVPRDCSNWCADELNVYVAARDRLWRIDAKSGALLSTWPVLTADAAPGEADWGCVIRAGDLLLGGSVRPEVSHRRLWTNDSWYDALTGELAAKVCSDNLFAMHPRTGERRWLHKGGLIVNCTLTATATHVYFIESRDDALMAAPSRRLEGDRFWSGARMVCLDLATGTKVWDQPLKTAPGTTSVQLAIADGILVLGCSHQKQYHTYAYAAADGAELWRATDNWFDGKDIGAAHHGTHMSRPVIVAGRLIVRPWLYDLKTGAKLPEKMPVIGEGHGCGTYAACQQALIFRSGDIAMWDFQKSSRSLWPRLRPDCWLSTIPALGMVLSPEAGGGCSCGSWMETSLGFIPAKPPPAKP